MNNKQYMACVAEAESYEDKGAYISDLCLSSMWDDAEGADIPEERIETLGQIWDACHRSIKDIAADAGLSQRKLAERFCIPYRTMENWCAGKSSAPIHERLMMQECLGLLKRK